MDSGVMIGLISVAAIQLIMVIAILRMSDNAKEILRILSDWERRNKSTNKILSNSAESPSKNWRCPKCDGLNSNASSYCKVCGAKR